MEKISRARGDSGDIIIYVGKCKNYEYEPQDIDYYARKAHRLKKEKNKLNIIDLERVERNNKSY